MAKLAQATVKYTIYARFEANGIVEKPDVIGAIFGQTEGLLGPDMDLRELQRTGRIGRIEVKIQNKNGKSSGIIIIPSSLDSSETALIAACCETIERIGPCNAKVRVEKIEDVRSEKRKYIIERAKELLQMLYDYGMEIEELSEQLKEAVRSAEITEYNGLPSGPNIENYDSIIIVEGRADVINLLKHGIKNVIAIEGTSIPETIIDLSKRKITTVFLDGDRGGDLILKELLSVADIDFIARAPRGKEVEELSKKEIFKALRNKVPVDQYQQEIMKNNNNTNTKEIKVNKKIEREKKEKFKEIFEEILGTRAACFLDENLNILGKVPVKEIFSVIKEIKADALILDSEIDQKIVDACAQAGIRYIVGKNIKGRIKAPEFITVLKALEL
ncbi:MAG TPA: DNA primase [Nanoarchaeota archaeon]|nr:DNA primase [Nanoarchaeota archaeon]